MKSKKGISLIVLVITIVVIIILAAAVLLSINNNNPFDNAKEAVSENDRDETQSAINLLLGNIMADIQDSVVISGDDGDAIKLSEAEIQTSSGASVYYSTEKKEYTTESSSNGEAIKFTEETLDIDQNILDNLYVTPKGKVKLASEVDAD